MRVGAQLANGSNTRKSGPVLPVAGTKAGTEAFEAKDNGVQSSTNYLVTIRYRTDTTEKHRIMYRGNILEILSCVDPDGLRRTLNIQATNYPGVQ
jgi:SPP1 family predicted phage head-tail adaptor